MFSTRRIFSQLSKGYYIALSAISTLDARVLRSYQQLDQNESRRTSQIRKHRLRSWKAFAYIAGFLCLLTTFVLYSHGQNVISTTILGTSRTSISKDDFIAAILRDPVEGLLDPEPIRNMCEEVKYQEGLVWHCDTIVGGIGNVGNMWLNCVRYAIEAGATTLVLPRLGIRNENLVDLGGGDQTTDLSYLFDVDYFLESWSTYCHQIRVVVSDSEVSNLPPSSSANSPHLAPASVKHFEMRKYLIVDPTGWREAFDTWLSKVPAFSTLSIQTPIRVWQDLVLCQWNREANPRDFANSFPRLFRYPLQTRRLAASVLWNLEKKLGRPIVPDGIIFSSGSSTTSKVNSLGRGRLSADGFFGVHMRVAADAAAAGWPGYEAQAPFYVAEAKKRNLSTIYLATGSPEHRDRFREDAQREGLTVVVKEDLLSDDEVAEVKSLTWDQQALVDFDVLMHSSYFYGFVRSSFSWSLALRRGTLPEAVGTMRITEGDEYRDELSAIVGRYPNINPEGLWP